MNSSVPVDRNWRHCCGRQVGLMRPRWMGWLQSCCHWVCSKMREKITRSNELNNLLESKINKQLFVSGLRSECCLSSVDLMGKSGGERVELSSCDLSASASDSICSSTQPPSVRSADTCSWLIDAGKLTLHNYLTLLMHVLREIFTMKHKGAEHNKIKGENRRSWRKIHYWWNHTALQWQHPLTTITSACSGSVQPLEGGRQPEFASHNQVLDKGIRSWENQSSGVCFDCRRTGNYLLVLWIKHPHVRNASDLLQFTEFPQSPKNWWENMFYSYVTGRKFKFTQGDEIL